VQTLALFVILPILVAYLLAAIFRQQISEMLPISYILGVLWVFTFGLLDKLSLGVNLILPVVGLLLGLTFWFNRELLINPKLLKQFVSPAIVLFLLASTWAFRHSQQMRLKEWDEFVYWGMQVKSLTLFDQLSPYAPVPGPFPEYLPGLPLLPYLVTSANGFWKEAFVYWAYQVFILAIIASLIANFTWKKWQTLISTILILLVASTMYFNSFQSVYADAILAILFAYSLILATTQNYSRNRGYLFNFALTITYIGLIKDIGIYFAFVSIFVFSINFGYGKLKTNLAKSILKFFRLSIALLLPILIFKLAWSNLLIKQGIAESRSIFTIISDFLKGELGQNSIPYWDQVISNFIGKAIYLPTTTFNAAPISALRWILIYAVLLIIIARPWRQKSEDSKISLLSTILVVVGFFGYLTILLFLYLTIFSENEALGLASFERYVNIYLAALAIVVSYKVVHAIYETPRNSNLPMFVWVWIVVLFFQSTPGNLISYVNSPNAYSDALRANYKGASWLISEMNLKSDDKVWIIAQHTVGFEFYMFQYEMLPAGVGKIPFSIGSPYGPGDLWTDSKMTPSKWDSRLNDFDYVFVYSATDSFIKEFGKMFDDPESLNKTSFYSIEHNSDGNRMIKVR
jgi:hypothetical protein